MSPIVEEFEKIASLPEPRWDHNTHYHRWLLRQLPARGKRALEVGCGRGRFCLELARRFDSVRGLDLTPAMVDAATSACASWPGVGLEVADFATWSAGDLRFDAIVCIATLHHLDLEPTLARIKALLAPGGRLAVLDLYRQQGAERLMSLAAFAPNLALQLLRTGRLRPPAAARAAWSEHGRGDRYATLAQVREAAGRILPGARVRAHLFWRYSLVWEKPH
jgi:SAM-dependent methyltransferase